VGLRGAQDAEADPEDVNVEFGGGNKKKRSDSTETGEELELVGMEGFMQEFFEEVRGYLLRL
jgi:hypothetical protein